MAESFMQDLVQGYGRPVDPSQGISAGFELAQRGQNMAVQMAQLRFQQQQLDMAKTNKQVEMLTDAANSEDGPTRKFKFAMAQKSAKQMGLPQLDPELEGLFTKSSEASQQLANGLANHDPTDPKYGQWFIQQLADAGNWGEATKVADTVQRQQNELRKAQIANTFRMANVGLREDQQGKTAGDVFDQNPQIKQFQSQAFNISRGMNTLNGQPTVKVANEVLQDFANALSQGKGSSNYKLQSVELPTLEGVIKNWTSFVDSNYDKPAPPAVVKYLQVQGTRLLGAYKDEIGSQADSVYSGREYPHNPVAQGVLDTKHKYYKNGGWLQDSPPPSPTQMKTSPVAPNLPQGPKKPSTAFIQALKTRFSDPGGAGPDIPKVKAFLEQNQYDSTGVQ